MRRARIILAAAAASLSQVALGVDYVWQNFAGGTYSWNQAGVWAPAGFPNAAGDTGTLSGAVTGGALNVALPSTVTLNTLTVGATGSPFTTDIGNGNSGGGALIFENGANTATLTTAGVAGALTNFSAPVQLGSTVQGPGAGGPPATMQTTFRVDGTSPVNFTGGIVVFADDNLGDGSIIQLRQLQLNVASITTGATYNFGNIALSQPGAVLRGSLHITSGQLNAPTITVNHGGTINFNGTISNGGANNGNLLLGHNLGNTGQPTVQPTYNLNNPNTYTGTTNLGKGNFILKHDGVFGNTGQVNFQYAASTYGSNLISDNDARTLSNPIQLQSNMTVAGENSITLNGPVFQSNNRELTNLLPAGKTVTINGPMAAATGTDGSTPTNRALLFEGPGKTVVNGPIYNHRNPWFNTSDNAQDRTVDGAFGSYGGVAKRGTGVVTINSTVLPTVGTGSTAFTGPTSTILGPTSVAGGLLQYLNPAAYGRIDVFNGPTFTISNSPGTNAVNVLAGGAIGVLDGTVTDDFVTKLNASTFSLGNNGGLALAPADAAKTLNFNSGSLAGAGVVNMSVGAVEAGVNFTGTITPNSTRGYRLGGGATLTLANVNALTGANNVTVTNGGAVVVALNNNYTGTTTVRGDYIQTNENQARTNANNNSFITVPTAIRVNSTLVVNTLANGGSPSGVGASVVGGGNLVLNGGTLKYTGTTTVSDRLFTIGPVGATLDASGTGALNLNNTAAVGLQDVGVLSAATISGATTTEKLLQGLPDISSITPGMTITVSTAAGGTFYPAGTVVQSIVPNFGFTGGTPFIINNQITVDQGIATGSVQVNNATLTFGNQNRNLSLSGSNTGANTLAALLVDSAAGKLGVVKSGAGNWTLTNNSTFTGGVTVNAGVLTVNRVRNNGTTTINGGTLKIAPGAVGDPANTSVFPEGQFTIAGRATPAGKFDVGKSGAVFEYITTSPEATIGALIDSAYGSGNWGGNGITSSDAAATPNNHAVGYAEASAVGNPATFLGQPVDSTTVLVRYTRQGDANLDGTSDIGDFSLLASNFNATGSKWSRGDFNFDQKTDIGDFALLAGNFNQAATGDLPRGGAVPEPATVSLLAAGLLMRRRRV